MTKLDNFAAVTVTSKMSKSGFSGLSIGMKGLQGVSDHRESTVRPKEIFKEKFPSADI